MRRQNGLLEARYQVFAPPFPLRFREWPRKVARDYYRWFMEQVDGRIEELRRVIEVVEARQDNPVDLSPDSLFDVGAFLLEQMATRSMTDADRARISTAIPEAIRSIVLGEESILDDTSLSLCFDAGIHLGETLRRACPIVEWALWTHKTVEFQRPVLVGFQEDVPLDPIQAGTSFGFSAIGDERSPNRLRGVFDWWAARTKTA